MVLQTTCKLGGRAKTKKSDLEKNRPHAYSGILCVEAAINRVSRCDRRTPLVLHLSLQRTEPSPLANQIEKNPGTYVGGIWKSEVGSQLPSTILDGGLEEHGLRRSLCSTGNSSQLLRSTKTSTSMEACRVTVTSIKEDVTCRATEVSLHIYIHRAIGREKRSSAAP